MRASAQLQKAGFGAAAPKCTQLNKRTPEPPTGARDTRPRRYPQTLRSPPPTPDKRRGCRAKRGRGHRREEGGRNRRARGHKAQPRTQRARSEGYPRARGAQTTRARPQGARRAAGRRKRERSEQKSGTRGGGARDAAERSEAAPRDPTPRGRPLCQGSVATAAATAGSGARENPRAQRGGFPSSLFGGREQAPDRPPRRGTKRSAAPQKGRTPPPTKLTKRAWPSGNEATTPQGAIKPFMPDKPLYYNFSPT